MEKKRTIASAVCPLDCPDTCGLKVEIEEGKIVSVNGDPNHPVTKGVICHKVRKFPERVNHPDRVLYPLKRVGEKGNFSFRRITWEEAYGEITRRYNDLISRYGPESILPYSFYGNMGLLNSDGMDRRFFHKLGSSHLEQTICNSAASVGFRYTMGRGVGIDPEDTVHSKLILIWGCNVISTNMHQMIYFNEARKRGAKIVVIDVHNNKTAKWGDWFVQLNPGTDTALALGMMHVLINEKLVDEAFVSKYAVGYEELVAHVQEYTPEYVSRITGVSADDIMKLAKMYGEATPSFIRIGNGLQHHENGGMMIRAITCLPALTGQWGVKGGGALKGNSAYAELNYAKLARADLRPSRNPRSVNMNQIGDALLQEELPIRSLFVYNSNPAQVAPDQNKVRKGLMREDLFTVVHDLFLTDTCKYADIVLPATSHFENTDLYKSYWHLYLQLQQPIIEPMGEAKSNFTLFKELAEWMGFTDDAFQVSEQDMINEALDSQNPSLAGITYERLAKEKHIKLNVTEQQMFPEYIPTPSGKIEFYSERMIRDGYHPLPHYEGVKENDHYPLTFVSGPNHQFLNSTMSNIKSLQKLEKEPILSLHPEEAMKRGIQNGNRVRVFNELGEVKLRIFVTEDVLPGVALTQGLWWDDEEGERISVNMLTPQKLADMGGGASFFSAKVECELI